MVSRMYLAQCSKSINDHNTNSNSCYALSMNYVKILLNIMLQISSLYSRTTNGYCLVFTSSTLSTVFRR